MKNFVASFRERFGLPLILISVLTISTFSGHATDRANASFYIDTFGAVDTESDWRVARAHEVFQALKRASGSATAAARLVVVDTNGHPWAVALADGNVVLSRGALDIIYEAAEKATADARLAFTLGHELAHLGSRDLWQQHVFASLSAISDDAAKELKAVQNAMVPSAFDAQVWRERELKADEIGYVIASLAGFPVNRIFAQERVEQGFLSLWEAQTQSSGPTHYGAGIRREFLQMRLNSAESKLDQFSLGVMLAHFGRYRDALLLFEDFQSYYPSSQSMSNLGFLHLQLARSEMPAAMANRFWSPSLLEMDSGLQVPTRSFADGLSKVAKEHLADAQRYLDQALALDPASEHASMNLAVVYHYLGKLHHARGVLEDALTQHKTSMRLLMLKALVMAEQEPGIDLWPRAVDQLQRLDSGTDTPPWVLFNLARLHEERGRLGKAEQYWVRLRPVMEQIPEGYLQQICIAIESDCSETSAMNGALTELTRDRRHFSLQPGDPLNFEQTSKVSRNFSVDYWQVQDLSGATVRGEEVTGFALEDTIELVRLLIPLDSRLNSQLQSLSKGLPFSIGDRNGLRYSARITTVERDDDILEFWLSR